MHDLHDFDAWPDDGVSRHGQRFETATDGRHLKLCIKPEPSSAARVSWRLKLW